MTFNPILFPIFLFLSPRIINTGEVKIFPSPSSVGLAKEVPKINRLILWCGFTGRWVCSVRGPTCFTNNDILPTKCIREVDNGRPFGIHKEVSSLINWCSFPKWKSISHDNVCFLKQNRVSLIGIINITNCYRHITITSIL